MSVESSAKAPKVGKLSSLSYFQIDASLSAGKYPQMLILTSNYLILQVNGYTLEAFKRTNFEKIPLQVSCSPQSRIIGTFEVTAISSLYSITENGGVYRWNMAIQENGKPPNFGKIQLGVNVGQIKLSQNERIGQIAHSDCGKYLAIQIWREGNKDPEKWGSVILKVHWVDSKGNLKYLAKIRQGIKESKFTSLLHS